MERKKTVVVCQSCLKSSNEGIPISDFYLVDNETNITIHCIKCIEKENLIPYKPYRKKRTTKK